MDIFVSPSHREGFGLSLIEANAMGKPVIATSISGYKDIVVEGKNGFFIESKNIDDLAQKMNYVITNKEILLDMRNDCIDLVSNKFNHDNVLKEALIYYSSII